jgi:carbohydrate diacid regulator
LKITSSFAQKIIDKLMENSEYSISITDESGMVIASRSLKNINTFNGAAVAALKNKEAIEIRKELAQKSGLVNPSIILPLFLGSEVIGTVIIEGEVSNIKKVAGIIKSSIETMVEYNLMREENRKKMREEEILIGDILARKPLDGTNSITSYCMKLGFDLGLSRSIILIELERKENRYFNINLDLGYDVSIENLKDELIKDIKANRYLTSQDIVGFYGSDQIIVVKSFITVADTNRMYLALDKVCRSILSDLSSNKIFTFYAASGNFYSNFTDLSDSYKEAQDTIKIGRVVKNTPGVYIIDDALLENVGYYLPSRISTKILLPLIKKLKKEDGTVDIELLYTVEGFIDSCMSFSKASQRLFLHRNTVAFRLEKFKKITGLNPITSFKDAFIIKMAAIYMKLNKIM